MNDIYNESLKKVSEGAPFSVDFKKRNLTIGGEKIILNGEYSGDLGIGCIPLEEVLETISILYSYYKHSVPSENSENKRKRYFVALKMEELSDDDMYFGVRRDISQAQLEIYILLNIINGNFKWKEELGSWFWQSGDDKDLIILRDWVE